MFPLRAHELRCYCVTMHLRMSAKLALLDFFANLFPSVRPLSCKAFWSHASPVLLWKDRYSSG